MVLKAQIFATDVAIALIIIMTMVAAFATKNADLTKSTSDNYETFSLQAKLLQASEIMISTHEKGFAKHEENAVKHHEINVTRVSLNKSALMLEDYDVCLTVKSPSLNSGNCNPYENKITRFAVCGEKICKIEISARSY